MRRALLLAALATLSGCAVITWPQERMQCGITCPKDSSCVVVGSQTFTNTYGCVCDYGYTDEGSRYPSKGHPCPPAKAR